MRRSSFPWAWLATALFLLSAGCTTNPVPPHSHPMAMVRPLAYTWPAGSAPPLEITCHFAGSSNPAATFADVFQEISGHFLPSEGNQLFYFDAGETRDGMVAITRVEELDDQWSSQPQGRRFPGSMRRTTELSFREFFRNVFPRPGHYRFFAFAITSDPLIGDRNDGSEAVEALINPTAGGHAFPPSENDELLTPEHHIWAILYAASMTNHQSVPRPNRGLNVASQLNNAGLETLNPDHCGSMQLATWEGRSQ